MTDWKEVLGNSLVVLLSVCLVFAALEASLALGVITSEDRFPRHKWCQGPDERGQFHPRYGVTDIPNQQYLEKRSSAETGDWHLTTINSEGFRDTYNSGNRTVIVLGDSFTKGLLADDNATYPHLLDRWAPNSSFRNYGMGGYGTDQELLVYEDVSDDYEHDLVILGYYFENDMRNNVNDSPRRPKYEVENGSLVRVRLPVNETDTSDPGDSSRKGPVASLKGFLRENTASYRYLAPRIGAILDGIGLVDREERKPPTDDELAEQKRITRLLITRIAERAERNNATLLVVGIPTRGEVNPDNPLYYTQEYAEQYAEEQRQMIEEVTAETPNTHFLGLKSSLVAEYEQGNQLYGVEDGHLTEYGYRVTAESIYRWLVAHEEIAPDSAANFSREYDRDYTTCP
jgi:lysophospholipase L1-like esterase